MNYEIKGDNLPVLLCRLDAGEQVMCESGAMSWMDDCIEMQTEGGGIGKVLGRMISGEALFQNRYVAKAAGEIAFASKFPGSIVAYEVTPDKPVILQKSSFLACVGQVELSVFLQKKISAGFFGGEGFIMQKVSGNGIVFAEIDGAALCYKLEAGQRKIVDTGYLAVMDATCSIEAQTVKGVKNVFLGGEGLFNTVITGPGQITLQTMPISKTAMMLYGHMPHPQSK